MKKISLFFILFFISYISVAQTVRTTTIVVIGNVHDSVPNYHPQILLGILEKVRPDLILHEVDAASAKEYFNTVGNGNEIKASTRYVRQHANTQRATFDFEGRNSYRRKKGMVPTDYLSIRLMDSLYESNLLSAEEKAAYEGYKNYTAELMKIAGGSPENFNNAVTDSICELRQNAQHYDLAKLQTHGGNLQLISLPDLMAGKYHIVTDTSFGPGFGISETKRWHKISLSTQATIREKPLQCSLDFFIGIIS